MFRVTTFNLSPDFRIAIPDLGSHDVGELDEQQLIALLENFRRVDPVQNHDARPQIVIDVLRRQFRIRTAQSKLFLRDDRTTAAADLEFDPAAIVREISRRHLETGEDTTQPAPSAKKTRRHGIAAITILAAGLSLNGYLLNSAFQIDDINETPPIELVTDPRELTSFRQSAVGRYATGNTPGDRAIAIGSDGRIHFKKITPSGERTDSEDSYRIGRRDTKLCLTTRECGVIDVTNIETIVYYRDVYRRTK